jgi:hypothetical protein
MLTFALVMSESRASIEPFAFQSIDSSLACTLTRRVDLDPDLDPTRCGCRARIADVWGEDCLQARCRCSPADSRATRRVNRTPRVHDLRRSRTGVTENSSARYRLSVGPGACATDSDSPPQSPRARRLRCRSPRAASRARGEPGVLPALPREPADEPLSVAQAS